MYHRLRNSEPGVVTCIFGPSSLSCSMVQIPSWPSEARYRTGAVHPLGSVDEMKPLLLRCVLRCNEPALRRFLVQSEVGADPMVLYGCFSRLQPQSIGMTGVLPDCEKARRRSRAENPLMPEARAS